MQKIMSVNLDANESAFFARELEHVKTKTYDIKYANLKAFQMVPVSTEAGPTAESITYEQYDARGVAKIIADYSDDLPRADVVAKEFTSPVKSIGNSYGYSIQEIRAAQERKRSLPTRKASAARRGHDQEHNRIAWFGDANTNLPGFLSNANIPVLTLAADGAGSSTKFVDKTPDQIIRDLNRMPNSIRALTKGVENPDTLLLPYEAYDHIASTPRSTTSDTTILEFFLRSNSAGIKFVEPVNEMEGAGTGGVNVAMCYDRNPDTLTLEMPQPFEQFPAQERGLEFIIPCHSRIGGTIVYYPLACVKVEGV